MTAAAQPAAQPGGEGVRTLTAAAIANAVGGRLVGDGSVEVTAIAPLDRARPGDVSFFASSKYASLFASTRAGVVLVTPELADADGDVPARIIVAKPHESLLALLPSLYAPAVREPGVHPTATIGRGAHIGSGVTIGPFVVVGGGARIGDRTWIESHVSIGTGVEIGTDCHLRPAVTLYEGSRLGNRVHLHAGVRIGSDGFGYVFRQGVHEKIPHVGRCLIEDDVEIGANTTIDRGSIDDTVIGAGTKIDNLVHVGHNVRIGRLCLLMAQVGIAGSTRIGDGVIFAGQAGIGGHINIGDGARIAGQAGVFGDVPAGESWSGYPARPHKESLRAHAALFKLAGMIRGLEKLVSKERA